MNKDILICGVGGQGTVLASKIIAASAMDMGETVHSAETIGMAQRGGSVTSHVRIGDDAYSPLIPLSSADMILAFEPAEAVRNLKYLKKGGTVIANTVATRPVSATLKDDGYDGSGMREYLESKCDCIFTDSEKICEGYGSVKFFNIIMLGIAAGSGRLGIDKETILKQIESKVPEKYREINKEAFMTGFAVGAGANVQTV